MVGGASNQYILEAGVPFSKDKCIVFARMSKILKLLLTSRQESFQGTFSGENIALWTQASTSLTISFGLVW